ncbi:MAG: hypothetical protein QOE27_134 [Solirubrobacteraceae bacterium]|nr:hypothetical protein [Solirubrobacteraceae bacterium]MEA2354832.1 hypothetical protein [Solirubrobacteraceae bacterium]
MLSFVLVLIGMVVVLAFLVNWAEPEDRPAQLEEARLAATRALRDLVHARPGRPTGYAGRARGEPSIPTPRPRPATTRRRARPVKRSRPPGSGRGR